MVKDIERTVNFYQDVLGFRVSHISEDKSFAIVQQGGAGIHFIRVESEEALKATAEQIAIYIWVDNVEAIHEAWKKKLAALPEGRYRPLFTQDYGMREFHVKDPDGCLLFFAEDVDPQKCARDFQAVHGQFPTAIL